jgi:predicted patatin/cPLA2 family phospholipase
MPLKKDYKIKNLVLSGGGFRGYATMGVYKALSDLDLVSEIERFAGNSIGTAISLLLVLKYTNDEILDLINSFEYSKIQDFSMTKFLDVWGVDSGKKLEAFTKAIIKNKLNNPDATMMDLYKWNPVEYTVSVTHLNTYQAIYYNWMNTPDEPVWRAVMKSGAVPGFFAPYREDGNVYVDGGLTDNFPIQLYPDVEETVGVLLEACHNDFREIVYPEDFVIHTMTCLVMGFSSFKVNICKKSIVLHLLLHDIPLLDPRMTVEDKMKIYQHGYDSTIEYFKLRGITINRHDLKEDEDKGEVDKKIEDHDPSSDDKKEVNCHDPSDEKKSEIGPQKI